MSKPDFESLVLLHDSDGAPVLSIARSSVHGQTRGWAAHFSRDGRGSDIPGAGGRGGNASGPDEDHDADPD